MLFADKKANHTHSNKSVLDLIEEAFTTALKAIYDAVVVNFNLHKDATTLVHGMGSGEEVARVQSVRRQED